jgi:hypothetical protein
VGAEPLQHVRPTVGDRKPSDMMAAMLEICPGGGGVKEPVGMPVSSVSAQGSQGQLSSADLKNLRSWLRRRTPSGLFMACPLSELYPERRKKGEECIRCRLFKKADAPVDINASDGPDVHWKCT